MTDSTGSETLRALVERIVPADDYPSGWQAGVGDFLRRILERDLADRAARAQRGAEPAGCRGAGAVRRHAVRRSAARGPGRYDHRPAGGRLRAALGTGAGERVPPDDDRSDGAGLLRRPGQRRQPRCRVLGHDRLPGIARPRAPGPDPTGRPRPPSPGRTPPITTTPSSSGAGAGGGVAACVLAEAGLRVLLVERGRWLIPATCAPTTCVAIGSRWATRSTGDPPAAGNPRVFAGAGRGDGGVADRPALAQQRDDHRRRDARLRRPGLAVLPRGLPDGQHLRHPRRQLAGRLAHLVRRPRAGLRPGRVGTRRLRRPGRQRVRRATPPRLPDAAAATQRHRGAAARRERLSSASAPRRSRCSSTPGRTTGEVRACSAGPASGSAAPASSRPAPPTPSIPRAVATGRCDVLTRTQAERVITDADGRVTGVALVAEVDGETIRRDITADRILLGSGCDRDRPPAAQQPFRP